MRNLDEVLIVLLADVNFSFPIRIITDNDVANSIFNTVIDDSSCRNAHGVIYSPIALAQIQILSPSYTSDTLLVLRCLQPCVFFIVQAIVTLEIFTVDENQSQMIALLSLPDAKETEKFIEQKALEGNPVENMTVKTIRKEIIQWNSKLADKNNNKSIKKENIPEIEFQQQEITTDNDSTQPKSVVVK